ncbi:C40 family peptidase [Carboxylicivirga sp. N1Y90]|uniref:C40 family peptidase n=1 Tax=Carboxylicivirga fragile TaxID=3417571 RepID=UPI003D33E539|nr:C40 family peptidase [Marinilabiliaceae bacterium N1Y90]
MHAFRHLIIASVVSLLFIVGCSNSGYDLLLAKTFDSKLKARIEQFASGGIENEWPIEFEKDALIEASKKYIGVKYRAGGTSGQGLDCSGLVYLSAREIGLKLPHHAEQMARYGQIVPTKGRLRQGDLVFFKGEGTRLINHVGIMVNHKEFIHVSSSKGCVVTPINDAYWKSLFLFGTR